MKKGVVLGINLGLIALVTAGLVVGNGILGQFENEINTLLAPPIIDKDAQNISSATGQAMASQIMEEGAVLLKNADNTLPLDRSSVKNVNVFGWRSIDWIYGSEGQNASGGVSPEDGFDKNVDIYKALNKYGVNYNKKLYDMYYNYKAPNHQSENIRGAHINNLTPLKEPFITDKNYYSDDLLNYSKEFSDTAFVVIGRMAGEGMNASTSEQKKDGPGSTTDGTRHYLEISTEEEELLKYCGENFKNVIVLLNVSNPFECGFLNDIPGIDACLYIGFTGTRAASALPKIIYGEQSPSGHTVDTFAYDLFTNPANIWTGGLTFSDYQRTYADHVEDIYVGYKWYETADAMGYWNNIDNQYGKGYDGIVQFPFGYGLSYNEFGWQVGEITIKKGDEPLKAFAPGESFSYSDKISIPVTVTNNGEYPGQDVVELYVTAPWTKGGIEKSSVQLASFNKTNVLQPGQSETINIEVDPYDFASYDCYDKNGNGFKGWELEKGEYSFKLQTDAHNIKTAAYNGKNQPAEFKFKVDEDYKIELDPITQQPVHNLFTGDDAIDRTPIDGNDGDFTADIPWLSRGEFKSLGEYKNLYKPRAATPSSKFDNKYSKGEAEAWDKATTDAFGQSVNTTAPRWGSGGNIKVTDNGVINATGKALGANYDDPKWNEVLDQVTVGEAVNLINNYYGTKAIDSIGKPALSDLDGPAQIGGFVSGPRGTGYPTMVVLAATWNPNLAYKFGKAFGDDMKGNSISGLWGWAIDSHRTAWFGRNHESPSEDSLLAGRIVTNAVKGLNTRGRYAFLKHFALYGYGGDSQYVTEQGLREIYLRPFRMAFVEGGALGAMTTYQGVGAEHSETTQALLVGVLRKEWQFKGAVTTDYIGNNNWAESIIRANGNLGMGVAIGKMGITYDQAYLDSHPRLSNRLREATHQTIYTWLRADYYQDQYIANPDPADKLVITNSINGWQWWKDLVYIINVCGGILLAMWGVLALIFFFMPKKKRVLVNEPKEKTSEKENVASAEILSRPDNDQTNGDSKAFKTDVSNLEIKEKEDK